MLKETYTKLIKPEGVYNGKKIKEGDVIELQTGGTGFVSRDGAKVQSSKYAQVGRWGRLGSWSCPRPLVS